jgi:hypothetical protein
VPVAKLQYTIRYSLQNVYRFNQPSCLISHDDNRFKNAVYKDLLTQNLKEELVRLSSLAGAVAIGLREGLARVGYPYAHE